MSSWKTLLAFIVMIFFTRTRALSTTGSNAKKVYDVVIIGGGSAGLTAAKVASTFDKSTLIVEQAKMGGDCTWTGCVPSKSLIAAAKAAHTMRTAQDKFGIGVSESAININMKDIKRKIQEKIEFIYDEDDSPEAMANMGIDTMVGQKATFLDASTLELQSTNDATSTTTIQANMGIIVATGAGPVEPSLPGLENVPYLTYEQVFELEEIPKRLTVVGGGPIGCELSQAFCRLGSQVTQISSSLLNKEEPEVSQELEKVFAKEGIQRCQGRVTQVEKDGKGHRITYEKSTDGSMGTVTGDMLLVAVGRKPNTKGFGLEEIGVELSESGHIETNDQLMTSVKGVYAAGDCTALQQFTHYAGFQGGTAARNIVLPFSDPGVKAPDQVPAATYTSPEVASVGMREAEAKEEFGDDKIEVAFKKMSEVDRSVCESEDAAGFIKIIYKKKNLQIVGATVMGPCAGELISEIGVAMYHKMPFDKLTYVTHAYPTYAIALQMMASDLLYAKTAKYKGALNALKKIGL